MIATPTVRLATAADAQAIARLSRDEIERGLPWRWTTVRVLRAIRDRQTNVVVAEQSAALAGFGIMRYGERRAHLLLLAVDRSCRVQGVGTRLLDWLEACARTAGLEAIDVEARADNVVALGFYGLHGYERFATAQGYYEGRIDAVRMRKVLMHTDEFTC